MDIQPMKKYVHLLNKTDSFEQESGKLVNVMYESVA